MIEAENSVTFEGIEYVIRQVNETTAGTRSIKKVEAVERFFVTLIDSPQPRIHNGSMTFNAALNFVFENTPYTFNVVDPFSAERFENFGRENALSLFNTVLERYGAEYTVAGNTVTLRRAKGARTDFAFRYGVNVKTLDKQIETHNIATAIRGYGGEPDENGKYPIEEVYISPHADLYPELRWADPVVDERLSTVDGMRARLQRVLIDEPQISVTVDFSDLRAAGYTADVPNEGDWGYIVYEPMDNFIAEARIVEVNREIDSNGRAIKTNVTLSNIRRRLTDAMTRFSRTAKQVDKLFAGQTKLPYNVLDDAVKIATQALLSAQTELKFENGIIAVDKTNANNVVLLNSAGLGISDDGGATFKTAMTGEGMVADVMTSGQINANNVSIYGGYLNNYTNIQGALLESRGQFRRTWRGEARNYDTSLRLENGYFRARNNTDDRSLYFSDFGISTFVDGSGGDVSSGTIEFFTQQYGEGNGITMHSFLGVVALNSEGNRIILDAQDSIYSESELGQMYFRPNKETRPGNNTFGMGVVDGSQSTLTDGLFYFGSSDNGWGSGLRFSKSGTPTVSVIDRDFERGGDTTLDSGRVRTNDVKKRDGSAEVYWNGSGTGTTGGAGANHSNTLRASAIRPRQGDSWFYLATDNGGSVAVTDYRGYNSGNGLTLRPIVASEYNGGSSYHTKQNIDKLSYEALPIIEKLEVVEYHLNSDVDSGIYDNRQVGFISELSPEIASNNLTAININKLLGYTVKAVQELTEEVRKLKEET